MFEEMTQERIVMGGDRVQLDLKVNIAFVRANRTMLD